MDSENTTPQKSRYRYIPNHPTMDSEKTTFEKTIGIGIDFQLSNNEFYT